MGFKVRNQVALYSLVFTFASFLKFLLRYQYDLSMVVKHPQLKNGFGWVLVGIAPVIYYCYVAQLALDIPIGDDFVVIINYLMRSDATDSWLVKWHELTFQFIEHRLVFTRLVAQVVRGVLGQLDFRWMIMIGNFCLLGVAGLLYRMLRGNGLSIWYLLPVMLIIFQPIVFESHFWSISATNYMPVCLFAMLAFYGVSRGTRSGLAGAWFMAIVATYTFGNGLITWPIGALILLLSQRWRALAVWVASTLFIIWAFYYGHNYHAQPSMLDNLRERFLMVMANFFLLVGACFNPVDTLHPFAQADLPALVAGVVITLTVLFFALRLALNHWLSTTSVRADRLSGVQHSAFFWATALFLLLSCAAFAVGRSTSNNVVTDSRYRDFSVFMTALAYCSVLLALAPARRRLWLGLTTMASLLFCVSSYAIYTPRLLLQNANFMAGAYNWHHNRHWLIYKGGSYFDTVTDKISADLEQVSWYRIPNYFTDLPTASMISEIVAPDTIDHKAQVAYWRSPVDPIGHNQPYYRVQTGNHIYLLPLRRSTSLTNWLRTGQALGKSFVTDFAYGRTLPVGRCTVEVFLHPAKKRLKVTPELVFNVRDE